MIKKKKKGFSLAEVIISIATLAFVSGFILQMFIVSEKVNKKALDLDVATSMATNSIELFMQEDDFEDYVALDFLQKGIVQIQKDKLIVTKFYDKNWGMIESTLEQLTENKLPENIKFVLNITIDKSKENLYYVSKTNNENHIEPNILFNINANILNILEEDIVKADLVDFTTVKYCKAKGIPIK